MRRARLALVEGGDHFEDSRVTGGFLILDEDKESLFGVFLCGPERIRGVSLSDPPVYRYVHCTTGYSGIL